MNFIVCIKQVPDVYAPLQIKDGQLIQDSERQVLNAYDASAVEEALVLREAHGGKVTVVLIGPEKAYETIRKALAMGADDGIHIKTAGTEKADSYVYATMLATFLKDRSYDVLSFGKQSQDTDSGLAGSMVAQMLGLPYATNAVGLAIEDGQLIVKRQGDTGQEMIALPTPCLVTCSNDMNNPRIPGLKGIMDSKRKPLEVVDAATLEGATAKTAVLGYEDKPKRKAGRKFEGEAEEIAVQVARLLNTEAGVLS